MQDSHLFEYAVIRVVPRVEREEFINTGVILYCARMKFLRAEFIFNEPRLTSFSSRLDTAEIACHFDAIMRICSGSKEGGPIALLDLASRFRWLTATRSTVVQTSKVHPGFCKDPQEMLDRLVLEQVF